MQCMHIYMDYRIFVAPKILIMSSVDVEYEVLDMPAPGCPFHLAIPVHNMEEGEINYVLLYKLNIVMCILG